MAAKKPPPDELIEEAARLRAGGMEWADVAKKLGKALSTVNHWPGMYRVKWKYFYAAAERAILEEASAESIFVLRQQLRSEDEGSSRDAAGKLIRTRENADDSDGPGVSHETLALAEYLGGLSDEDLDALVDELAPRFGLARVAGAGDGGPPPRAT